MAHQSDIEESAALQLDFQKLQQVVAACGEILPVAVQDSETQEVLIIAYVNREALRLSLEERRAVFYSTSRKEIWRKGETSGDILHLDEVRVNCEQNSLLFLVHKGGRGVCHTKDASGEHRQSCYYRRLTAAETLEFLKT
ncbi:MAG: phosphoribosyl-AMP cyclohydrolase [Spirochaetes bacterium]|nr:phosphoribosyl-AMP cyclohydrolase [Spirochaetota bacterium]MBX3722585.1 phosphoribosyl-AMP cyclohydrolase [Turneriella sp.]